MPIWYSIALCGCSLSSWFVSAKAKVAVRSCGKPVYELGSNILTESSIGMENYVQQQPCKLETDSFSTDKSEEHASEPLCGKSQPVLCAETKQRSFPTSGCCDTDAQAGGTSVCPLPSCAVFDAVSASLVRTLEIEPTGPSSVCTVEMMCDWAHGFGRVHCITQSLSSRLPRVTVTYIDSRDCQRAKDEFGKLYPAVALECSSDEPDHDLTGALQACVHSSGVPCLRCLCHWFAVA